jgi:hypothetical protein
MEFIAECLWPGVGESDLRALDERATSSVAALAATGAAVSYGGSILMRADEVVLCLFEGQPEPVRQAAEDAQIPFDRILETARSPWGAGTTQFAQEGKLT